MCAGLVGFLLYIIYFHYANKGTYHPCIRAVPGLQLQSPNGLQPMPADSGLVLRTVEGEGLELQAVQRFAHKIDQCPALLQFHGGRAGDDRCID